MEENELEIKVGDHVQVIISAWDENETPTFKNFYEGKVTEVFERSKHAFYVRLENLDRLIPIDRVIA